MMKIQNIAGRDLAYRVNDHAQGHALIFIHGSGGDHHGWDGQCDDLGRDFHVVALDLPGHGSSGGAGEDDVMRYRERVQGMIAALNIQHHLIIGHSLGGAVALAAALTPADTLSGIVVVGGGARMPVNSMVLEGLLKDPAAIMRFAADVAVAKKNRDRLRPFLTEGFQRCEPAVIHGDFLACDRFDITGTVSRIQVPALIICGEDDKMMPPQFSRHLAAQIEHSTLSLIPECGHFPMLETPDVFNALLRKFAEELPH